MPKDPTENIGRYKIRGGQINEYEFQQNEGEIEAQEGRERAEDLPVEGLQGAVEPGLPQNVAKRIQQIEAMVRAKVRGRGQQAAESNPKAGAKTAPPMKSGTAKKSSAKKTAAKKPAAKKSATKKAGKTGATKKAAGKKTSAKKSAAARPAAKKR